MEVIGTVQRVSFGAVPGTGTIGMDGVVKDGEYIGGPVELEFMNAPHGIGVICGREIVIDTAARTLCLSDRAEPIAAVEIESGPLGRFSVRVCFSQELTAKALSLPSFKG